MREERIETVDGIHVRGNVEVFGFDLDAISDYEAYRKLRALSNSPMRFLFWRGITYHEHGHNLIPNAGLNFIAQLLTAEATGSVSHCGVGSSNAANSGAMVDLTTIIGSRKAVTSEYYEANGKAHFEFFFGGTDNAGTWAEVDIATGAVIAGAVKQIARKLLSSPFVKINTPNTGANAALVSWLLTFTATGT